jgi:outer membrane protein assembly factor BamB
MKKLVITALLVGVLSAVSVLGAEPRGRVLVILYRSDRDFVEMAMSRELGAIRRALENAGFDVVTATASGEHIEGAVKSFQPDLGLADVRVENYVGVVVPCMVSNDPPDARAVSIVRQAWRLGKPVAAQDGGIPTLRDAGVLDGRHFAADAQSSSLFPGALYSGTGVVVDGNLVTSGTCPFKADERNLPDGTAEMARKFISLLGGTAAATTTAAAAAAAPAGYDWPRWRGPEGSGATRERAWNPAGLKGAGTLWEANVGTGLSGMAIRDNRIVTMGLVSGETTVFCLDAASGEMLWKVPVKGAWMPPQASPTIDGDRVFCLTNSVLLCISLSSGDVLWASKDLVRGVRPARGMASPPIVEGDLLLVNQNTEALAFNKATGEFAWRAHDDLPASSRGSYAVPAVLDLDGKRRALFLGPSSLYLVDIASGTKLWSVPHGDASYVGADLVLDGGKVLVATASSCVQVDLSRNQPVPLWSNADLAGWISSPLVYRGNLYASCMAVEASRQVLDGIKGIMSNSFLFIPTANFAKGLEELESKDFAFRCADWATGKVAWERKMPVVSFIAAGEYLILQQLNGTLRVVAAAASGYQELSTTGVLCRSDPPRLYSTEPVLCNGRLYCRSFSGDLSCIDLRPPSP